MLLDTITTRQAQELQTAHSLINDCLFGGKLSDRVRLQVTYLPRTSDGGIFLANKWDEKNENNCHEITIDEHLLTLDQSLWVASLVHQMTHQCQHECGKPPNNGRHYHNKEFAMIMKNFGLPLTSLDRDRNQDCEVGQKVDYFIEPEGRFQKMIQLLGDQLVITSQPRNAGIQLEVSSKTPKNLGYKYFCPKCNESITSIAQDINVICGKCSIRYKADARAN